MTTATAVLPTWRAGTWEDFLVLLQQPAYQYAKAYYWQGAYQLVMGVGAQHGDINAVILLLLSFYCTLRAIPYRAFVNTSYRKEAVCEFQPDVFCYFLELQVPTGSCIVNLEEYQPPDLVIEVADTSLADDLGIKRMLYEEIGIREYWVVDAQRLEIFAFAIESNLGSRRIGESVVLSGLSLQAVTEALQKSQTLDHSQLGQWWMERLAH
ncbi:MAG: Uma2 family endonuclease [Pseudanabaenaceae cyanobacterium SKYGB_i_bin29]|nr:Uma2 family endonuclease [Pseudanabaenaceae cyanobacterium SKYG29]MDW8421504.1 Uma2 family endonuclease [Pseudanabaenaceae cyanobacterium SKYGB_i_bin29]